MADPRKAVLTFGKKSIPVSISFKNGMFVVKSDDKKKNAMITNYIKTGTVGSVSSEDIKSKRDVAMGRAGLKEEIQERAGEILERNRNGLGPNDDGDRSKGRRKGNCDKKYMGKKTKGLEKSLYTDKYDKKSKYYAKKTEYECKYCGKEFDDEKKYKAHMTACSGE